MSEKNFVDSEHVYAAICDFEVIAYATSQEEAQKIIDDHKQKLNLISFLKKSFVRKVIKGKCKLPSETKHFYIARVIS